MRVALIGLLILVGGMGCRDRSAADVPTTDSVQTTFFGTAEEKKLRKELWENVNPEDGISAAEADVIAKT